MSREFVLDIETKNTFADVGANDPSLLEISLIGFYDYANDEFGAYRENELGKLWPRLEHAERIIGYNIKAFDYPVMQRYYGGDLSRLPTLDILEEIKNILGFRIKLDDVAHHTLGQRKSGDGLKAVEYFRDGNWEALEKYCIDDVRLTRDVYEFGKKHGELLYSNRNGPAKMKVQFALPEQKSHGINLTLPL